MGWLATYLTLPNIIYALGFIDVILGALPNDVIKYKGTILPVAKALSEYETSKGKLK